MKKSLQKFCDLHSGSQRRASQTDLCRYLRCVGYVYSVLLLVTVVKLSLSIDSTSDRAWGLTSVVIYLLNIPCLHATAYSPNLSIIHWSMITVSCLILVNVAEFIYTLINSRALWAILNVIAAIIQTQTLLTLRTLEVIVSFGDKQALESQSGANKCDADHDTPRHETTLYESDMDGEEAKEADD
jgi:hypothetical protein